MYIESVLSHTSPYIRTSTLMTVITSSFNDTATPEIYTLSLHDALPISSSRSCRASSGLFCFMRTSESRARLRSDRKSTRLNSSHVEISYAVFCLKKKKVRAQLFGTGRVDSSRGKPRQGTPDAVDLHDRR